MSEPRNEQSARFSEHFDKFINTISMKNMNEVVTRGVLKETLTEALGVTKQELMLVMRETLTEFEKRIAGRFDSIENRLGSLESRVELGFFELNERLDAEQAFTSDMWDDFSTRLALLEAK